MKNTVEYQASEISRILDSGIEIIPNSPIHNALKKALNMSVVGVKLPTNEDALNQIGKRLFEENVKYKRVLNTDKLNGYMTGFLDCYEWIKSNGN